MRIRRFLIGLVLATLLAWICLIAILKYFDPSDQNSLVLAFFYIFLFSSLVGSFFLIDFLVRRITNRKKDQMSQIKVSLRQGMLLALILSIGLYLQSNANFHWWSLLILIAVAVSIEWLLSKIKYVS